MAQRVSMRCRGNAEGSVVAWASWSRAVSPERETKDESRAHEHRNITIYSVLKTSSGSRIRIRTKSLEPSRFPEVLVTCVEL